MRRVFYGWVIVAAAIGMVGVASGTLSSLAVFLRPMQDSMGWTRGEISGVALWMWTTYGIGALLWGTLSDRWGARRVALVGGVLLGLGLVVASRITLLWQLYDTVGGVVGLATRATTGVAHTAVQVADPALRATVKAIAEIAIEELDLNAIVRDHVDIDAIAARIDLDPIIDRVDVGKVIDKVDLDGVVAKVDLDAAVSRVDLDAVIDRVDVGRVIDKVDLDGVVAKVNLDAAVSRVDLDAAVSRVDMDKIINRIDLAGIANNVIEEIDLPEIIRESTGSLGADAVQGVRAQSMQADDAIAGFVGRLLGRDRRAEPT